MGSAAFGGVTPTWGAVRSLLALAQGVVTGRSYLILTAVGESCCRHTERNTCIREQQRLQPASAGFEPCASLRNRGRLREQRERVRGVVCARWCQRGSLSSPGPREYCKEPRTQGNGDVFAGAASDDRVGHELVAWPIWHVELLDFTPFCGAAEISFDGITALLR
jgi:hypothetical protein